MRRLKWSAALFLTGVLAACGGGNKTALSVTVSPGSSTVVLGVGTQQFLAQVGGSNDQCISWSVSQGTGTPVVGGNAMLGTITNSSCTTSSTGTVNSGGNGLYTAPATLPNPATLIITATADADKKTTGTGTVTVDSGIRVQVTPPNPIMATGDTVQFAATVNGTQNTSVNWSVNNIAGGNSTIGTISATGLFTAPSTAESVTITATSGSDTSKSGSTQAAVVVGANPILGLLDINTVSQGEIQQDFYASGTNFLSTSALMVNGTAVSTAFLSQTFLRGRIPASLLATAGTLSVLVKPQHGTNSNAINVTVAPERSAIIASTPDSAPANGGAGGSATVGITGGYYSASTTAEFNGAPKTATVVNPRQLTVGLSASDLANPGLFELALHTAGTPAISAVNLAVTPPAAAVLSSPAFTLAVGTAPVGVAINTATGVAAVLNQGASGSPGTVNLVDLKTTPPTVGAAITVGNVPTGIAVDNSLNEALVVNSKDKTLSVIDMGAGTVTATVTLAPMDAALIPFSVGVNPLTHRVIVANQQTNIADILDDSANPPTNVCTVGGDPLNVQKDSCLGAMNVTQPVSTGLTPQIAIEERLNWAVVTPGGAGTITVVDLGKPATATDVARIPNPFANLTISTSLEGVAINPETEQAILTDPNSSFAELFSVLDQTVSPISLNNPGLVAAAADQLSDLGVVVNATANTASVIDLRTQLTIVTVPLGANAIPAAVAVDPVSSLAVVADKGNGTVSILQLGAVRSLQVVETNPPVTLNSSNPLQVTVIGNGFVAGSNVRLDESTVGIATVLVSARKLTATIPANLLSEPNVPHRYILDVQNPDGTVSNASDLTVIESVPVGKAPVAVAVDSPHNQAVVTNSGDGTISVVNLATGNASPPIAVGSDPLGVAVIPRLQRAIVTNNVSNTASIVDLVARTVATVPLPNGSLPRGVALDLDTDLAVIANEGSNSVSLVSLDTGTILGTVLVDTQPVAVAVDPALDVAGVATSNSGTLDIVNLANASLQARIPGFQVPTGVALDPTNDVFLVANSLQNNVVAVDPVTQTTNQAGVGINPTSLDYNFQSSTMVTVNTASNTVSVLGFLATKGMAGLQVQLGKVRAVLSIAASSQSSVGINPVTNVAVIADQANNRVLLVPLPR
ncbi:MAG: hypothetical protein ACRD50_07645 [Candidatus Acidiferrales bacterium]